MQAPFYTAAQSKLGEPEAAWISAERAIVAAERAGDALMMPAGAFRLGFVFLRARHFDQAEENARTAAEALWFLVDQGKPDAMSLWGGLTPSVSGSGGTRGDEVP